jgi:hypothetical protein
LAYSQKAGHGSWKLVVGIQTKKKIGALVSCKDTLAYKYKQ